MKSSEKSEALRTHSERFFTVWGKVLCTGFCRVPAFSEDPQETDSERTRCFENGGRRTTRNGKKWEETRRELRVEWNSELEMTENLEWVKGIVWEEGRLHQEESDSSLQSPLTKTTPHIKISRTQWYDSRIKGKKVGTREGKVITNYTSSWN